MIDDLIFFESNGTYLLICAFENKDVHAIDYATGDIMHEFIFKDDSNPQLEEGKSLSRHSQTMRHTEARAVLVTPSDSKTRLSQTRRMISDGSRGSLYKNRKGSPNNIDERTLIQRFMPHRDAATKKKEIFRNFRASINKKLADQVDEVLNEDIKSQRLGKDRP